MFDEIYQRFIANNKYPRTLKSLEFLQGFSSMHIKHNGQQLLNFSSSDYLGLAKHPLLIARSQEFAARYGVGATASRLVSGNFDIYAELEEKLAKALNKPAALILGSGYQTNISVLEALLNAEVLGEKPVVYCDKLSHISMLLSPIHMADLYRYQHNDLTHLRKLLAKNISSRPKFILAESIYSMEGDEASLVELVAIAKEYNAFLYIDDAHAVGVYGWGKAVEYANDIPIIMGTFSKALGSYGGYIGCSETVKNYLVNKCRGLIYSTALSPAVLGAISAAIEILPQLTEERNQVLQHANNLRQFFHENNINFGNSTTHIVPWIIGDAKQTLHISDELLKNEILATAIQPPSVPVGKSRIRFCLSAGHTIENMVELKEIILKM